MKQLEQICSNILAARGAVPESVSFKESLEQFLCPPPRVRQEGVIRGSELGNPCHKKVWYNINRERLGIEKPDLPNNARFKFFYGHLLEEVALLLADIAGHKVEGQQQEVTLDYRGYKIVGHIDAIIDDILVDVKSAASPSFSKYMKDFEANDTFGYKGQLMFYAYCLGKPKAGFIFIDKQLGHIKPITITVDEEWLFNHLDSLIDDLNEEEPPRRIEDKEAKSGGNRTLQTICSYCDYKKDCWKDANNGQGLRGFRYAHKIEWLTEVNKLPKVEEI